MIGGEVGRFAVVGGVAYATDVLVFNILRMAGVAPVSAKVASSLLAVAVAFAGSRWWTWRDRGGPGVARQYALFLLFSALAAGIQLTCLVVSRDLMALRSALADNLSANVIGMALATAFRFWAFRTLVFAEPAQVRSAGDGTPTRARDAARS